MGPYNATGTPASTSIDAVLLAEVLRLGTFNRDAIQQLLEDRDRALLLELQRLIPTLSVNDSTAATPSTSRQKSAPRNADGGPAPKLKPERVHPQVAEHPQHTAFKVTKGRIRTHFHHLMGVRTAQEIGPHLMTCRPLTEQEQEDYLKKRPTRFVITADNFRVDLVLPRTHSFNKDAINVFADSFLEALASGGYSNPAKLADIFWEKDNVETAFFNHLKNVKGNYYRRFVRIETEEARFDRLAAASRSSRKTR
ncbi:hypothetical protein PENSPDRAFT_672765, partial [Peniophora sp. CONT]